MKIKDLIDAMERFAPREYAEEYDNPGLLIDNDGRDIRRVLVALDCTSEVVREAKEGHFDLILTHHPLIFLPVKQITGKSFVTATAKELIRNNIAFFCAHTNLDRADGGVNDVLAGIFDLHDVEKVSPGNFGRVGNLPDAVSLLYFIHTVNEKLGTIAKCATAHFRSDPENIMVRRVAVMGGSGGDDTEVMCKYGADVYITGEVKHNRAIDAQFLGLNLIEAGHYETERIVLPALIAYLQNETFDVQYKMSEYERSPLRAF